MHPDLEYVFGLFEHTTRKKNSDYAVYANPFSNFDFTGMILDEAVSEGIRGPDLSFVALITTKPARIAEQRRHRMWILRVERMFSAAHLIPGHPKCGTMHGHNWKVTVELRAWKLVAPGWIADFTEVKKTIDEVLSRYDHKVLNEIIDPPTAEILAANFFTELKAHFQDIEHIAVHSVTVEETPGCSAVFTNAPEEIRQEKKGPLHFVQDIALKLDITDILSQMARTSCRKEDWNA